MLSREEIRQRIRDILAEEQIDEATDEIPALLTFRRGAIRTLSDGRKIAEYHHPNSGIILVFPMMFSKGDKR